MGVSQVACRNFKMSRVGVLFRIHNAVENLATYICLRQSFVAISFERCRYFLAHVACRNLPWQGLLKGLEAISSCFVSQIHALASSTMNSKISMLHAATPRAVLKISRSLCGQRVRVFVNKTLTIVSNQNKISNSFYFTQ